MTLWNTTNSEYYADRSALSFSQLRDFDQYGPEGYKKLYVTGEWVKEPTDAMEFGSLIHRVLCDGRDLDSCVVFPPADVLAKNGARSTNAYRDWAATMMESNRKIVNDNEYAKAREIVDAVRACPMASQMQHAEYQEQAFRWSMEGVEWRCKIDMITPNYILDLKTTAKPLDIRSIERLVYESRYHWQAAIYAEALKFANMRPRPFVFVLVEKSEPYRVRCVTIEEKCEPVACQELFGDGGLVPRILEHRRSGDWTDKAAKGLLTVGLPSWAGKTINVEVVDG